MNNNEGTNITFSEQIAYGLVSPKRYKDIIKLRTYRFVAYTIVIMFVLAIITFAVPTAATISGFGGFDKLFTESIPDFVVNDGKLDIEDSFKMSFNGFNLVIDDSKLELEDTDIVKDGYSLAVGKEKIRIVYKNGNEVSDVLGSVDINEVLPDGFDNGELKSIAPVLYISLVITLVFTAAGFFVSYGVMALLFAIVVNSMNKAMKIGLKFGQVFQLCFYGQSFAMLVSNINLAANFVSPIIVTVIGMFVTVHMITKGLVYMNSNIPGDM